MVFIKLDHLAKSRKIQRLLATPDEILIDTIDLTEDNYMHNAYSDEHQFIGD